MRKQQGHATVAALWAVATILMSLAATSLINHMTARPPLDERALVMATPMVETKSVSLDPTLVAALKESGVKQMAIEPIGTSTAAFYILVNGVEVPQNYSTAATVEQMYRLDVSGDKPRVWVTEQIQRSWEPQLVSYYLDRELTSFLEKQRQLASLRKQWKQAPQV